ncbi:MAG: alpha/beta hydrolase [Flavobacteriaceae bacterium]|nr:alpha/beta hydrolase [Flavobacteriaceae bacterium]|tara:strand:- start:852 stop:1499 length:648 start_codon:yes stop_codon:yes gene_type:complete
MLKSIYLMPGMAANPRIFEFLMFPDNFQVFRLSWITPYKGESIQNYAKRMCERIKHPKPILIGVSMGGILVQEMASFLDYDKLIIVSSVKSNKELPSHMKLAQITNAHRLLPTQWIKNIESLSIFVLGNSLKKRFELYERYLSERDPDYLSWAIDVIVNWKKAEAIKDVIHIHGKSDTVFPIKNIISPCIEIPGDHAIILTQHNWFNKNLPNIIQ